ncbi:MAG: hypothetical protein KQ78_01801 [Candidatus Izimaplasma bacterium HR2]|nr:MAG: hypothetical protein KQ78_01801 [Candidatus Izimaplasma bacterium HR2]
MKVMLVIMLIGLLVMGLILTGFQEQISVLEDQQVTLLLKLEEENIARRAAITNLDEVTFEADKALADYQNTMVDYINNNLVTAEYIEYMYEVFDVRTRDLKSMIEALQGE